MSNKQKMTQERLFLVKEGQNLKKTSLDLKFLTIDPHFFALSNQNEKNRTLWWWCFS